MTDKRNEDTDEQTPTSGAGYGDNAYELQQDEAEDGGEAASERSA